MKVVWSNGCFDVLHRGHVEMLTYARSLGDRLIVGVDTDEKVKLDKGPDRPIHTFEDRKFVLEGLRSVDEVIGFSTPDELSFLVMSVAPDIMVVGEEYRDRTVVGGQYAKEIVYYERIGEYSTTSIVSHLAAR